MAINNVKFGGIDLATAKSITLNGNKKVKEIKLNGNIIWPLNNVPKISSFTLYNNDNVETSNLELPKSTDTITYTLMFDQNYYEAYSRYKGSPELAAKAIESNISFTSYTTHFACKIDWNYNTSDFYLDFTNTNYTGSDLDVGSFDWIVYEDEFGNRGVIYGGFVIPDLYNNSGEEIPQYYYSWEDGPHEEWTENGLWYISGWGFIYDSEGNQIDQFSISNSYEPETEISLGYDLVYQAPSRP